MERQQKKRGKKVKKNLMKNFLWLSFGKRIKKRRECKKIEKKQQAQVIVAYMCSEVRLVLYNDTTAVVVVGAPTWCAPVELSLSIRVIWIIVSSPLALVSTSTPEKKQPSVFHSFCFDLFFPLFSSPSHVTRFLLTFTHSQNLYYKWWYFIREI